MHAEISFKNLNQAEKTQIHLVHEAKKPLEIKLCEHLVKMDKANNGIITRAIAENNFDGKRNRFVSIFVHDKQASKIIIAGMGDAAPKNAERAAREIGAEITTCLMNHKIKSASIFVEKGLGKLKDVETAANIAYGARMKSYSFLKYFTKKKEEEKPSLKTLTINVKNEKEAASKFISLKAISDGVFLARDYVSEPPNVIYPESYANHIKKTLTPLGVKVTILDAKEMTKLGMHSLLGVGIGSTKESRVVVMEYNGGKKNDAPISFIGKGVTFDTGGISIKPADGMQDMKYDMGGSAAVVGAMYAIAARKAKINVVGAVGLVENMPDGNAQRPSDIVVSMSGQTIEVLNTDAEGRLVLADVLWYVQDKYNPKFMVDIATLTGAVTIALGQHKAGLMSNDDALAKQLYEVGEEVGEPLWRLPLGEEYNKQMDSKITDMQNISNMKGGGTVTAACFLQRFVNGKKWAHLDIAGVAWADRNNKPLSPEGATGFGVQIFDRLAAKHEGK